MKTETLTAVSDSWSSVTLAEYAALRLAASPDAAARIDAYAIRRYKAGAYPLAGEAPVLTEAGRAWLASVASEAASALSASNAGPARAIARRIVGALGVLAVLNA